MHRILSKSDLELVIPSGYCAIVRLVNNDINSLLTDAFKADDSSKIRAEYLRFFDGIESLDILAWAFKTTEGIKIFKLSEVPAFT